MAGADLRPSERIGEDARFAELRRSGARAGDDLLYVRVLANGLGHSRLGLAVGRKAGGAVKRTRLRRMIREAFRLNKGMLPGSLDVLAAPRAGAAGASLEELGRSLVRLAARAAGEPGAGKGEGGK